MLEQHQSRARDIQLDPLASAAEPVATGPVSSSISQASATPRSSENSNPSNAQNGSFLNNPNLYFKAPTGFFYRSPPQSLNESDDNSTVDIVTVPAVGGHPMNTWRLPPKHSDLDHVMSVESVDGPVTPTAMQRAILEAGVTMSTGYSVPSSSFGQPWIIHDLRRKMRKARVLVYSHGEPEEGCNIESLSMKLLNHVLAERQGDKKSKRPLFFISHSTGGLVVKAALIKAQEAKSPYNVIGDNCYGVAFFATPHQGSSYLSSPDFSDIIRRAMHLQWPIPTSLQKQLGLKTDTLAKMSRAWMPVAAELNIWTFYETFDTDLTNRKARDEEVISFLAPITSIKSAILELHHEIDRPLQANHGDCAAFGPGNEYPKKSFLNKLNEATTKAEELSKKEHASFNLDNLIEVEVHGFYESTEQALSGAHHKRPIRLWSTRNPLDTFMRVGPTECLRSRLQEKTIPPPPTQMINPASSRRTSFRVDENSRPGPSTDGSSKNVAKENQKQKGKSAALQKGRPPLGSSTRSQDPIVSVAASDGVQRRFSSPLIYPASSPLALSLTPLENAQNTTTPSPANMPSVLVSEHDEPSAAPSSTSATRKNEMNPVSTTRSAAEQPPLTQNLKNTITASSKSGGSPQTNPSKSLNPSASNQTERLSPQPVPPRLSVKTVSPPSTARHDSDDSGSESTGGEPPTAGPLTRPDPENQKLMWVHLAFNNPKWVSDIFSRIAKEKGKKFHEILLGPTSWCKRHIRGRHTQYHACFVKPGCLLMNPLLEPASESRTPLSKPPPDIMMSLYLPYLHWDTYKRMVKRRDIVKERLIQGRSRPTPKKIGKLDLELKVAWKYLGYDPPFHTRRTLDQFGYPNLLDTRARDDDQMLYKMTKIHYREEEPSESEKQTQSGNMSDESIDEDDEGVKAEQREGSYEHLKDGKVLMVDQVWLWIADSTTVVTFFAQRQAISFEGKLYQQADLRNSIYNEVNGDLSRRCENSLDLAALVALHAVTLLFERSSHRELEIFRIFEQAISILVEEMTSSFKYFRAKGFQAVADDDDSDDDPDSIRELHKVEGKKFRDQVRENVSALLELRDIDDELWTLKRLFIEQEASIADMLRHYEDCGYGDTNGFTFLHEAQSKLKDYLHRIEEMIASAKRTKLDFEKLLDLVQRQANVDEARRSRWQVDLQSFQSRAIMIFTVFTIIFLPLSFFTGFFGMNTLQWGGTNGQMVSLHTILEASIPLSVLIIAIALILALSTPVRRRVKFAFKFIVNPFEIAEPPASPSASTPIASKRKPKRQLKKFKKAKPKSEENEKDLKDFWEDHRDKKVDIYEVPAHNRRLHLSSNKKPGSRKSTLDTFSWKSKLGRKSQDKTAMDSTGTQV